MPSFKKYRQKIRHGANSTIKVSNTIRMPGSLRCLDQLGS